MADDSPSNEVARKRTSPEEYKGAADIAVHFSHKTINSNIAGGGIRLCKRDGLALPYISARTLLAAGYELDLEYTTNNGLLSAVLNVASGTDDLADLPKPVADEIRHVVNQELDLMEEHFESNVHTISTRQRQLLIPDDNQPNGYVAVTPIASVAVCKLVNQAVRSHNDKQKEIRDNGGEATHRFIPFAEMGFGGSKFQNVGRLTAFLRRVPVFPGPRADGKIRAAYGVHHRGLTLRMPELVLLEFVQWTYEQQRKNEGIVPINAEAKEELDIFAARIVDYVLLAARRSQLILKSHKDKLPNTSQTADLTVADSVIPEIAGLIDREYRSSSWRPDTAKLIVDSVLSYVGQSESGMAWSVDLPDALQEYLEQAIRKELPL